MLQRLRHILKSKHRPTRRYHSTTVYKWRLSLWNQVNILQHSLLFVIIHASAGQTGTRFPKPNVINVCFVSIFSGFITGKEDHYYILSLRTLISASFLLAWPGILLSVAAIITAKKVHHSYPRFIARANYQARGNQYCDVH